MVDWAKTSLVERWAESFKNANLRNLHEHGSGYIFEFDTDWLEREIRDEVRKRWGLSQAATRDYADLALSTIYEGLRQVTLSKLDSVGIELKGAYCYWREARP